MDDWKSAFTHGTLVILPDAKTSNMVNRLRQKHDPSSQKICDAHITLTQPFLNEPDDNAWQKIHDIINQFETFDILFGSIDTFENTPILKFHIEPKEALVSLRNYLHETELFNLSLPFTKDFIPHMTISESGISTPREAIQLAEELNKTISTGSFQCNEISYMRPNNEFHFELQKALSLNCL